MSVNEAIKYLTTFGLAGNFGVNEAGCVLRDEIEHLRAELKAARGLLETAIDARESIGDPNKPFHPTSTAIWLSGAWYDKAKEIVGGEE